MVRILPGLGSRVEGFPSLSSESSSPSIRADQFIVPDIPLPALQYGTPSSPASLEDVASSRLSDVLSKNNSALMTHINIILKLNGDLEHISEVSRFRFNEYELQIMKLKKENQDLKKAKKKDQNEDGEESAVTALSSPENPKKEKTKKDKKNSKNNNAINEEIELKNKEIQELKENLESLEIKSREEIEEISSHKLSLERDLANLRKDAETWATEKWELGAANTELQNRLQQMANYMQESPEKMLQEEIRKIQLSLSDERKVTEKLSRSLELEKRKVESLEQKAKAVNGSRKSQQQKSSSINLPEEMRTRDERLADSMEKYRIQCENLVSSLRECEDKLMVSSENPQFNELKDEIHRVKKLLSDDKKRSSMEQHKMCEMSSLFGQVFKDYQNALESLKDLQNEKKMKNQQQNVYEEIKESNYKSQLDSLTAKLLQTEEKVKEEESKVGSLKNKLKQVDIDLEALPILRAQVDVYQSDFNAERAAREKIAGEKADLEEELRTIKSQGVNRALGSGGAVDQQRQMERILATETLPGTSSALRNTINNLADNSFTNSQSGQFNYTCPKCNASFSLLVDVERHVNICIE